MKKITFVQKDDNTSYDPVNTFFSKTKASSVAKPTVNLSKQSSSVKTPIQKSIQTKKQKANHFQQANQLIPQKIGQKGGSGYIPKKVPGFGQNSCQNLKEQTIYNLKQKQLEDKKNQTTFGEKANKTNKNLNLEKKPDMIFDVPKVKYDEQDDNIEILNAIQQNELQKMSPEDSKKLSKNKLPQIKSPTTNLKGQSQGSNFQKPQIPKFQNNAQKVAKPTVKDKYFHINEQKIEFQQEKSDTTEIKAKFQQQSGKKTIQIPRQKNSSNLQKPNSSKQIINTPLNKNQEKQQSQKQSSLQKYKPTNNFQQRIKQLQSYEKEYQSKIQYLEQRIQTLTKVQQKYSKVVKEHKLCQQKSKDLTQMSQQLQEAKQSIEKFLSQPKVPYSKKRQYLLLNQINQLKKANRQLVLRIKNYKGSDLMEMAISKNKQEIGRQFQIDYQEVYNKMNTQIQSHLSVLINKIYEYLEIKSGKNKKTTKQQMTFDKEQRFLLELNSIAVKISLAYLEKYEVSPLPKYNQESMNLYAQIQKEKVNIMKALKINKLTDPEQINFAITQNNLQIINDLQQNIGQIDSLQEKILTQLKPEQKQKANNRPGTSYGAQNKNTTKILLKKVSLILQLFKKRSTISTAFHIQSVCYFTFMKEILQKKLKKLQKQLVNLYARIKEIKDIYELGGNTAKQSLYLYLETHLQNFTLTVPNLQFDIKQVKSTYHEISKGIDRKISINSL